MNVISVIIPIYNIVQYLPQCIESVLKQEDVDIQIILVDDGSTDGSEILCDKYAATDERVQVVHKNNGGLSDARNAGTAIAVGDYIYYLDGDDYLETGALKLLLDYAIRYNCDAVQSGIYYTYSTHLLYRNLSVGNKVLNRSAAMDALAQQDVVKNFAWGKLYKTEVVRKFKFPIGKYFEDSYWQYKVLNGVNRYGVLMQPLVFYRQREDSISGSINIRMLDLLLGEEEMLTFYLRYYPESLPTMLRTYWKNVYVLSQIIRMNGDNESKQIVNHYCSEAIRRNKTLMDTYLKHCFSYRFFCYPRLLKIYDFAKRAIQYLNRIINKEQTYLVKQI